MVAMLVSAPTAYMNALVVNIHIVVNVPPSKMTTSNIAQNAIGNVSDV